MARKDNKQPQNTPVKKLASQRNAALVAAALIAVATVVVYFRVSGSDFVNLDDDIYVYENAMVASGLTAKSIGWAFTSFHATNWHPVTWISHQIDASLFGNDAGSHHLVSLALHIANAVLLFSLLRKITGSLWKSAIAAAVFALHPAHVESVAWIAERKDVLSTLFWLLATISYARFAKNADDKTFYWIALILFGVGLMAKPMLVTFPFVLLLLDYWPLKRIDEPSFAKVRPLILEKLPFFALSLISAIVTVVAQKSGGAVQSLEVFSLQDRLLNALVSYGRYVAMLFYPVNLGVWYPFDGDISPLQIAASAILLLGVSALAVWQIRQRPYLFTGWFWFIGTLVPVIGLVQVGRQALADRYTYIPYIGLSIAVIWLIADVAGRVQIPKIAIRSVGVAAVVALAVVAFGQVSYWQNSETLYTRALQVTKNNYLVEANYCRYLENRNRVEEAFRHCSSAVEVDPRGVVALNTLGSLQLKQSKPEDAKASFQKVIEIDPDYALAYANLSIAESRLGNLETALAYFDQALSHDRDGFFDAGRRAETYSSIGSAAMARKRYDLAGRAYERALEATPSNGEFQRSLAMAYRSEGRGEEAIKLLQSIIQKYPNSPETYNTLGIIYAEQNRMPEAVAQFQKALQINPGFTPAQTNLRRALDSK